MKYFQLIDRLGIDRWFLGEIYTKDNAEVNVWDFLLGVSIEKYKNINLAIDVTHKGEMLDFTFAGFDIPIVNEKLLNIIHSEVTALPVNIISKKKIEHSFYVILPNNQIDCIDENKSVFHRWEEGNDIRPDLAGQYSFFEKLIVDPEKLNGYNLIRIKNFNGQLIINEDLKKKFLLNKISGIKYKLV